MNAFISTSILLFALINLFLFVEIVRSESDCTVNVNTNNNYGKTLPGGPTKIDPNSKDVKKIVEKLTKKMNTQPNMDCKVYVDKIIEAYSQVVEGESTSLKMKLCPYDCLDKTININVCKICTATVWEKAWENFFKVTCFSCD